jgi:hypothetical protein
MKKLFFAISIFLLLGLVPAVHAGFEPSPFRDDVGKLGAVSNNLASINDRLNQVLSTSLDPLIRRVNQLGAIEGEIVVINGRINAVLFALQPDPPDMPRVIEAWTEVRDNAQAIVDTADAALKNTYEGEDTALIGVRNAAEDIVDLANENLPGNDLEN